MSPSNLKQALDQTFEVLTRSNASQVLGSNNPKEIKQAIQEALPQENHAFSEVLQEFEEKLMPYLNRNTDPNYAAYITGSGNPVGAIAEYIKAFYNQNGLKWNNSPIASELEQLVICWIGEFLDVPHRKGVLTSGGSMSNLLAIHFALARKFPEREQEGLFGLQKITVYASSETHSSVERAMVFLGLGRKQLRKIPCNSNFQLDIETLENQLIEDQNAGSLPLMLIANAGTTNTGSIDDLVACGEAARKYNLWYHVDGAYGIPAKALEELSPRFDGAELADSITINPHKWLYVPFEASAILLNDIPKAIHFDPDYLYTENQGERWESSEHTIELSKEFRALKIWFTLKYYGKNQIASFIRHDIEMVEQFAKKLSEVEYMEVVDEHPLSILCFRYFNPELNDEENNQINRNALKKIESEGQVFLTGTKIHGRQYLRIYFGNPNRTTIDLDRMVGVVKESLKGQ